MFYLGRARYIFCIFLAVLLMSSCTSNAQINTEDSAATPSESGNTSSVGANSPSASVPVREPTNPTPSLPAVNGCTIDEIELDPTNKFDKVLEEAIKDAELEEHCVASGDAVLLEYDQPYAGLPSRIGDYYLISPYAMDHGLSCDINYSIDDYFDSPALSGVTDQWLFVTYLNHEGITEANKHEFCGDVEYATAKGFNGAKDEKFPGIVEIAIDTTESNAKDTGLRCSSTVLVRACVNFFEESALNNIAVRTAVDETDPEGQEAFLLQFLTSFMAGSPAIQDLFSGAENVDDTGACGLIPLDGHFSDELQQRNDEEVASKNFTEASINGIRCQVPGDAVFSEAFIEAGFKLVGIEQLSPGQILYTVSNGTCTVPVSYWTDSGYSPDKIQGPDNVLSEDMAVAFNYGRDTKCT